MSNSVVCKFFSEKIAFGGENPVFGKKSGILGAEPLGERVANNGV